MYKSLRRRLLSFFYQYALFGGDLDLVAAGCRLPTSPDPTIADGNGYADPASDDDAQRSQ